MTGVTIDHLVATTAFIAAILVFTGLFTQTIQAAILYQQNRHVALKASDLLDSTLLTPGFPYNWGETNKTLSCFGLQKPGESGYVLSSFALMRLVSLTGESVEYPIGSGVWYSNISMGPGGYLFVPMSDSIDYKTASRLLGVNGSYGFQLNISPIVEVSISESRANPLRLRVEARGPGFPLSGASLGYYLFRTLKTGNYPTIVLSTGTAQTNSSGAVNLDFAFSGSTETYVIVVYARLSGLLGLGYYTHKTFTKGAGVMPFVVDYEVGKVYLAHDWDVNGVGAPPVPNYFYNASFHALTGESTFQEWPIANSTGQINYGGGGGKYLYGETVLPVGHPGFLLVTYRCGNEYGMSVMPWGIGTLAASVAFGDDPAGNVWTANDLRQATVDMLAYQAKITCWSLQGYQIWNPSGLW
ncbi:MAG: hypothetical protein WCC63_05260 [Candidatus Bathyarchaeia archaeon]